MGRELYDSRAEGHVPLDICYACHAIWFDQYESAQLTPGAVMKLFQAIHEKRDETPRPLSDACRCPVCRRGLKLTYDIQRTNRITYYRCVEGHGRLTTFMQFLREKNFVRSLTPAEIERLKVTVTQVRCTSCGAAVNIERDAQCPYCRAPLAILDADAVKRTLAELSDEERARTRLPDPAAAVDAMLAGQRLGRDRERAQFRFDAQAPIEGGEGVDLVAGALDFLMQNFRR
jgi:hypothetical protein